MTTLDTLLTATRQELFATIQGGHPIDPAALADRQFRGVSLGMPALVDRLLWKTFLKTFHRDPETGALRGWNVRLHQDGLDAPPRPIEKAGAPFTFGHYAVRPLRPDEAPGGLRHGLMLDYGAGGNGWWDPAGALRDPLVAVHAGQTSLLLGWTYALVAGVRVSTPSYFALTPAGPLSHRADAPSA